MAGDSAEKTPKGLPDLPFIRHIQRVLLDVCVCVCVSSCACCCVYVCVYVCSFLIYAFLDCVWCDGGREGSATVADINCLGA